MIRTQVYLPEDLYNELKLLSATGGGKFSALVREGINLVIKKKQSRKKNDLGKWKGFIGIIKGGSKVSGQDLIDDYYENDVV